MSDRTSHGPYVSVVEEFEVAGSDLTVVVRKLRTRKGERLEFDVPAEDSSLRVDALGLESLAWQDPDVFSQFLATDYTPEPLGESSDGGTSLASFELTNEYAHVRVRRLSYPEGDTLEICAPKKRERLQATPEALTGLASQDHTVFSTFLEEPHGPEDHH